MAEIPPLIKHIIDVKFKYMIIRNKNVVIDKDCNYYMRTKHREYNTMDYLHLLGLIPGALTPTLLHPSAKIRMVPTSKGLSVHVTKAMDWKKTFDTLSKLAKKQQ